MGTRMRGADWLLLALLLVAPVLALYRCVAWSRMPMLLAWLLLANGATWLGYVLDKRWAQAAKGRLPERVLHLAELLGGWPGALVAQQLLRHKTRKVSYQWVFWGIVGLHQLFWGDWLLLGGKFSRQILPQWAGLM